MLQQTNYSILATCITTTSKITLGVYRSSGKELEKGQEEKKLKSKWAAKASVVLP